MRAVREMQCQIPLCRRGIPDQVVQLDTLQVESDGGLSCSFRVLKLCRALTVFGPVTILKESQGVLIPYELLHGPTVWDAAGEARDSLELGWPGRD